MDYELREGFDSVRALKSKVTLFAMGLVVASAMAAGEVAKDAGAKATFLGVSTTPVDAGLAAHLGLKTGFYQTVQYVAPESPAAKAGLEAHDILQKLDDQIIVNFAQLTALIRSKQSGDKVSLTVLRQGKAKQFEATLGEQEVAVEVHDFDGDQLKHNYHPQRTFRFHTGAGVLDDLPESIRKHVREFSQDREVPFFRREKKAGRDEDKPDEPKGSGGGASGTSSNSSVTVHAGGKITRVVKDSNRGELHYSKADGNATLKAVGPDGKVLFDGPINTDAEKAKAPAEVLEWLGEVSGNQPIQPRIKPQKRLRRSIRSKDATDA